MDGFSEDRAFAYLRLAAAEFGCGRREDGYHYLEKTLRIYSAYAALPIGTELMYSCNALSLISHRKEKSTVEVLSKVRSYLADPEYGRDFFECVCGEARFAELLAQLC